MAGYFLGEETRRSDQELHNVAPHARPDCSAQRAAVCVCVCVWVCVCVCVSVCVCVCEVSETVKSADFLKKHSKCKEKKK